MRKRKKSSVLIHKPVLPSTRRLVLPLIFGLMVLIVAVFARHGVDHGGVVSRADGGTAGLLIWILTPALLAWVFRRLDADVRTTQPFAFQRSSLRLSVGVMILAALAVWMVIKLGLAMGGLVMDPLTAPPPFARRMLDLASVAVFALLEESAWRGYLMPALLARFRYTVVLGVGAVIWFAWHLPYLDVLSASYTVESTTTLAPRLFLGVLAMQLVYIELFLKSRSVWPAFALHATLNIVAQINLSSGLTLNRTHTWAFSPSADGLPIMALCTVVGLAMYSVRMSRERRREKPAQGKRHAG